MKNTIGKKFIALLTAVVFCATTFAVTGASVDKAYAESESIELPSTAYVVYFPKYPGNSYEWLAWEPDVIIDMDSLVYSNEGIVELVRYENPGDYNFYELRGHKVGSATLTFYAKAGEAGSWQMVTMNVKVVKYVRPVKTFKVGKKSYTGKFKYKDYYYSKKKVSGKLVVAPIKGWKITSIYKYTNKTDTFKKIKNKTKVTLKSGDAIEVSIKKKGTGRYEYLYLGR